METINHECYVSFEVAKLLRQLGFDWECDYHYADNTLCHGFCNNDPMFKIIISAPTIDVTQRWLREVKGYNVLVCHDFKWNKHVWWILQDNDLLCHNYATLFDTYEEALEAGINKALELILEKGE